MLKAAVVGHQFVERMLALVAEGGMAEVMRQCDGRGEVFIEAQRAGDVARDGSHFHRVRESCAKMVAGAV